MIFKNSVFSLAASALLLTGCLDSGTDSAPIAPAPPAVNQPPVVNAGADQLVLTGAAVSLNGSGSDPDGSVASLAWTQTSGSAVTLSGASTGTPTFTAPATATTLVFSLTVTDNLGLARSDSVTVDVNAAPSVNAGSDQSVIAGANVALNGTASDANGSIASYAWTQTSGTAVTLAGGTTAAATFTAPSSAGMLAFQLTVTDNQGATSSDTVNVQVNSLAAPVIVRQPTNVIAYENGLALMFVVAQGENLNYEWHYSPSGVQWSSGPEPYMLRGSAVGGLSMADDGRCFYVIVSNAAGSATSEPGCLSVIEIEGHADPSDDDTGDNRSMAVSYGNATMEVIRAAVGSEMGSVAFPNRSGVPRMLGPPHNCSGGTYVGATLDGQPVTQGMSLPLGQHTITEIWEHCGNGDVDEPRVHSGGTMISYDFPDTFGVGSYTMYLSGHGEYPELGSLALVMNGILHVTIDNSENGSYVYDEIDIELEPHFAAAAFRLSTAIGSDSISLTRRMNVDPTEGADTTLDWRVNWVDFDEDGAIGTLYKQSSTSSDIRLHFDPVEGDTGEDPNTADGQFTIWIDGDVGSYYCGRIVPMFTNRGWMFTNDEPEGPQFPGDDD